jgi:hypothetical protein
MQNTGETIVTTLLEIPAPFLELGWRRPVFFLWENAAENSKCIVVWPPAFVWNGGLT